MNHTDQSTRGGKEEILAERNAPQTRANRCAWRLGPSPGLAQKASPQPCARGIVLFSPRSNHLFTEKKDLKKYKLLPCKIKVPLSGASGRAGSWGRERVSVAQSQLPNFKVFSTVNFDQCILNSLPLQHRGVRSGEARSCAGSGRAETPTPSLRQTKSPEAPAEALTPEPRMGAW